MMTERSPSDHSKPGSIPLVIGLGNEHRSDDRSGLEVARGLKGPLAGKAKVIECTSEGIALFDLWRDFDHVLVVDAVRSGAPAGTVHRLEPGDGALLGFRGATSTHGLSLAEAVALAKGLDCLPHHLVIYGIEADNLSVGVGMTPPVARGVEEVIARILAELGSPHDGSPNPARSPVHA